MPKSDLPLEPGYAPVADRIALFYARHPEGRIITDLVSREDGVVTFRARVYRSAEERRPAATGWAAEREGDGDINTVACLENTETSAIGRALANLGFLASTKRPSAEEMRKAARARAGARAPGTRHPAPGTAFTVREARGDGPAGNDGSLPSPAITDLLDLLAIAAAAGLPPDRAADLRAKLERAPLAPRQLERIARWLRRWLDDRENGHHAADGGASIAPPGA